MKFNKYLLLEKKHMMYHGTRSRHLTNIKSQGLRIDSPTNKKVHGHGDTADKIFLADTYNEAFYFISQFVTNGEPIAILQIQPNFEYSTLNRPHEWVTYEDIRPSLISIWIERIKRRQYKRPDLIPLKKLQNPDNINYINYELLHGRDKTVALKYWSNE